MYNIFRYLLFTGMWAALRQWERDPGSLHLESSRFYSPNWFRADLLFSGHVDLSRSYAVHVWHRNAPIPDSPAEFLALNSTLGWVARRVYYGI